MEQLIHETKLETQPWANFERRDRYKEKKEKALHAYLNTDMTVAQIMKEYGISRNAIYDYINKCGKKRTDKKNSK